MILSLLGISPRATIHYVDNPLYPTSIKFRGSLLHTDSIVRSTLWKIVIVWGESVICISFRLKGITLGFQPTQTLDKFKTNNACMSYQPNF